MEVPQYYKNNYLTLFGCQVLKDYWTTKVSSGSGLASLPIDYERSENECGSVTNLDLNFPLTVHQRLSALTNDSPFLVYTVILAALKICLYKYTGSAVVVGSPALRQDNHLKQASNVLPIVANIDKNCSVEHFLIQIRQVLLGAYARQNYSIECLLGNLKEEFKKNKCLLFNIVLVLDGMHYKMPEVGNDLTIVCRWFEGRISGNLKFKTSLFEPKTVEGFAKHYVKTVEAVLNNTKVRISELQNLTEAEQQHLLVNWNNTHAAYQISSSLHELFEEQVKRTPNAVAFIFEGQEYTYKILNRKANQLALRLRELGVGPEAIIAVCLNPSFEMVITLLAIIKAGGAYVTLMTDNPISRLYEILNETRPYLLVVGRETDWFTKYTGRKIVLNDFWAACGEKYPGNLDNQRRAENLLSVVYTSSSTGKPKGILITMDSVLNRLLWMWDSYPFFPNDVLLLYKSPALVGAFWEYFGALLKGIPTLIVSREEVVDPPRLWRKLTSHKVTWITVSPALLEGIIDQGERHPGEFSSLRIATTSAESIHPKMVARWYKVFSNVPLLNLYGATECSSNVTVYNTADLSPLQGRVPVGKPIANNQIYLLDSNLKPVPIGGLGEMYVAGACVARGYLNAPKLTASQFIANPFSTDSGARFYKTGDWARYRSDGNLELIGRKDYQVKIRGFRVDLSEIETNLLQHEKLYKCAVTFQGKEANRKRLIVYFTAREKLSPNALRQFLAAKLPGYMVPSEFLQLETLPTTPTGKIDFKNLPDPCTFLRDSNEMFVEPRVEMERQICTILQDVLAVEKVGVQDHFLDLNIHSLLMIQVQSRLQELLNIEVPVTDLFRYPTASVLAEYLSESSNESSFLEKSRERVKQQKSAINRQNKLARFLRGK